MAGPGKRGLLPAIKPFAEAWGPKWGKGMHTSPPDPEAHLSKQRHPAEQGPGLPGISPVTVEEPPELPDFISHDSHERREEVSHKSYVASFGGLEKAHLC